MLKTCLKTTMLFCGMLAAFTSCNKPLLSPEGSSSLLLGNGSRTAGLPAQERTYYEGLSQNQVQSILGFRGNHNDMDATGYYVAPGDSITVTVTQISGNTLPVLVIGTPFRDNIRPVRTYRNLVAGTQTVAGDQYGGLIYIRYVTSANPSAVAKVAFGTGCKPVPYYRKGVTTHEQWVAALDSINNVPDVVLESDRTILVATLADAITYKNENQDLIVGRVDSIVESQDAISGLDGSSSIHQKPPHKHLITVRDPAAGGLMAAGVSIYYTQSVSYRMLQPLYLSNGNGWGIWHEIGHTYQQSAWNWSNVVEKTVNVYALASERMFQLPNTRLTTNNQWPVFNQYLQTPQSDRNFNSTANFLGLVMYHQLWLAFGDNLYIQLSRQTREERPVLSTTEEKMRYFMLKACTISQKNLSDFFRKWGFLVNESVYNEIASLNLPNPEVDLTTLTD